MYGEGYEGESASDYYTQAPRQQQRAPRRFSQPAMPAAAHADDEYSERDLGEYAFSGAAPGRPPIQGRYSLPPNAGQQQDWGARSAYSSPPPPRATSLEVGSVYSRDSAPAAYNYPAQAAYPGGDPFTAGARWDEAPPPNEHYWYQGPPPPHYARPQSVASSRTYTDSRGGHAAVRMSHPPTLYPASPDAEGAPAVFGIDAPHHAPGGRRHAEQRRDTGPYGDGGGGDNLPNFPAWSRTWYDGHLSANGHAYTTAPPSGSGWESETLTRSGGSRPGGPPYGHVYGRPGDHNMTDFVKEERMRMLEKEFGAPRTKHAKGNNDDDEDDDEKYDEEEEEEAVLGSVDQNGKLVTERPKLMLAVRCLQGLTALAALACGIGGALLIKTGNVKPAARGTMPAYILYAASIITILILAYLFVFRPCCCDPMRKHNKTAGAPGAGGPLGGLVIPVLSGGGGPGGKPPRGMKMKKGMQQGGPVVNLIVDPSLLGQGRSKGRKGEESSDDSDDERLPGEARRKRRRRAPLGVIGNMQLQARWRIARHSAKLYAIWDAILAVIWLAASIVALGMGKKCSPGSANGWCDFYNAAIACGVIFAVVSCVALWFDYRALAVSKRAPRPPM